jgi:hypothetical protein
MVCKVMNPSVEILVDQYITIYKHPNIIYVLPFLHWTCGSMRNNDGVAGTLCVSHDLDLEENLLSYQNNGNIHNLMKILPYLLEVTYSSKPVHNNDNVGNNQAKEKERYVKKGFY